MLFQFLLIPLALAGPPNTFRGIEFKTQCSEIPDLVEIDRAGDIVVYTRKDDRMSIGDVPLKSVWYSCWKGVFSDVTVLFDPDYQSTLYRALSSEWGQGKQSNRYMPVYLWFEKDSKTNAHFDGLRGTLMILDAHLYDQRHAEQATVKEGDL